MFWSIFSRGPHEDPKSNLPVLPDMDEEGIVDPILIAQRLRDTPPLTLRMDNSDTELHIPLGLGMYYSPTIRTTAENDWPDPRHAILLLENVTVDTVRTLVTWMEIGSVKLRPLETLDLVPTSWLTASCDLLWQLWQLAEYLAIPQLCTHILGKLNEVFEKSKMCNIATPLTPGLLTATCEQHDDPDQVGMAAPSLSDTGRFWAAIKKHFISAVVQPQTKAKVDLVSFMPCIVMPAYGRLLLEIIEQLTEEREVKAIKQQQANERARITKAEKRKRDGSNDESDEAGPSAEKKRAIAQIERNVVQRDSDESMSNYEQDGQQA